MTAPLPKSERVPNLLSERRSHPPRDRVARLLDVLPDDLAAGVSAWVADPEGRPLERHLGLDRIAHRLAVRNFHLNRAFARIDPSLSHRARRIALAAEIGRFAAAVWPEACERRSPDPAWSALRRELFLAFAAGGPVPRTARGLWEIIGRDVSHHACQNDPDADRNQL